MSMPFQIPLIAAAGGMGQNTASNLPFTSDPTVRSFRPNGRSIGELRVAADGSQQYTTITAAVTAAMALQTTRRTAEGLPRLTPDYRVDIIVYPGLYTGNIAPGPFLAFYREGPAGSVTLRQDVNDNVPLLGVIQTNGNLYWEGIDLVEVYDTDTNTPKYPVHAVNNGTSIFANCTFDNQLGGPQTPFGMDGADGGTTLIYNCTLKPGGTNCHGWPTTTIVQTMMYINCTATGVVVWNAQNNVAPDQLWVVGGNVFGIQLTGNAGKLHRDPATIVGAGGVVSPSTDNNTNWPIPYGGLSPADRLYWGLP